MSDWRAYLTSEEALLVDGYDQRTAMIEALASRNKADRAAYKAAVLAAKSRCPRLAPSRAARTDLKRAVHLVSDGLSYAQAARRLGLTRNQVAGAVFRARRSA